MQFICISLAFLHSDSSIFPMFLLIIFWISYVQFMLNQQANVCVCARARVRALCVFAVSADHCVQLHVYTIYAK